MRGILSICLALGLVGCGDDDGGGTPMEDGGPMTPDTGPRPDSGPRLDAGPPPGDGNDTPATADDIMVDAMAPTAGAIDPAGDDDWYTFEGMAGQWIRIGTEANPDDDPTMVDTVVTLYDSTMTQIAENDDSVPRVNTDSEIVTLLPTAGTYYIRVQEFSEWAGDPEEGMPSFTYELTVVAVSDMAPAVTMDTEAGDDIASALPATTAMNFGLILGTFDDAADVDVYTVTVPGTEAMAVNLDLMPVGPMGYGSSSTARVRVTDAAGATIISRTDQELDQPDNEPSLLPGMYQVFVEHSPAAAGTNDFYVMKLFIVGENPPETSEVTNDLPATPDTVMMTDRMGGQSGFVLSHLITPMDVDHFAFTVTAGNTISVFCGSAQNGSGVQGLTLTLLSPDGMMELGTATETPTEGAMIMDVDPMSTGENYLLRLTKTGQDAEVTGDWVRCGLHTNVPM